MLSSTYALALSCPNRPGIIATITGCLFAHGANITEAQQFDDISTGIFFARIAFSLRQDAREEVEAALSEASAKLDMNWRLIDLSHQPRVLILVSRFDHCLADLLYRWRIGELNIKLLDLSLTTHATPTITMISMALRSTIFQLDQTTK